MTIYLPIAELPINIFLILGLGLAAGILAGMFGIGGGFLLTPLLMFIGIPPAVAVATSSNQIIASSLSGFLAHWYRKNVDIRMGLYLLLGGIIGSGIGVWLFSLLKAIGQIDVMIALVYVLFLGVIGAFMLIESVQSWRNKDALEEKAKQAFQARSLYHRLSEAKLPFMVHFPHSDITISAIFPILVGLVAGMLVSIMGIGGGFIMIPAMIYILGMPTAVVIGTSLFQIVFVTSIVTVLHATTTQSVDIVLAFLLLTGGVIGAQIGSKLSSKLAPEKLRILLALMVLLVCIRLGLGLVLTPSDLFTVEALH